MSFGLKVHKACPKQPCRHCFHQGWRVLTSLCQLIWVTASFTTGRHLSSPHSTPQIDARVCARVCTDGLKDTYTVSNQSNNHSPMLTQEWHKHWNTNSVTTALTNDNTTSASSSTLNANANPPLNTKQPPPIHHVSTTTISSFSIQHRQYLMPQLSTWKYRTSFEHVTIAGCRILATL